MEPKNYSSIRAILKKEQGEKVAPYVFKLNDTKKLEEYLKKEQITFETYLEEKNSKEYKKADAKKTKKSVKDKNTYEKK